MCKTHTQLGLLAMNYCINAACFNRALFKQTAFSGMTFCGLSSLWRVLIINKNQISCLLPDCCYMYWMYWNWLWILIYSNFKWNIWDRLSNLKSHKVKKKQLEIFHTTCNVYRTILKVYLFKSNQNKEVFFKIIFWYILRSTGITLAVCLWPY